MRLRILLLCALAAGLAAPSFAGNALSAKGKVVDPNGKPVPGVKVYAVMEWYDPTGVGGRGQHHTVKAGALSGEDGSFEMSLPPLRQKAASARYYFIAFAPDKWLGWRRGAGKLSPHDSGIPEPDEYVITVSKPTVFEGVVVDEEGSGIAGAEVKLEQFFRRSDGIGMNPTGIEPVVKLRPAITGAGGKFKMTSVPEGVEVCFQVERRGYATIRYSAYGTDRLVMRRGGSVSGRVVDERGDPVSWAGVSARKVGDWGYARTGRDGSYTIDSLGPGTYTISASVKDGIVRGIEGVVVAARETAHVPDLTAVPGVSITGRVLEERAGRPIRGVCVTASDSEQWPAVWNSASEPTDKHGDYKLRVLPGDVYVRAYPSDRLYESGEPPALNVPEGGLTGADLKLWKADVARGRAVDGAGRPVAGASVRLYVAQGPGGPQAFADAKGNFEIAVPRERATGGG